MLRLDINKGKCLFFDFFFIYLNIPDPFLQKFKQTLTFKEYWSWWDLQIAAFKKVPLSFLFTFKHWITYDDLVLLA